MSDLFTTRAEFTDRAPLARRMRPRSLVEVVGQGHLTAPGAPLHSMLFTLAGHGSGTAPSSVVLYGPPGCGKTTLAGVIAETAGAGFAELSAITAGVKDVRAVVAAGRDRLAAHGTRTVLFIDEIHRFSKSQQDALLPAVEDGHVVLVAATTENPNFALIRPLLSRSIVLPLKPVQADDVRALVARAVTDKRGLGGAVSFTDDALDAVVARSGGDVRKALTLTEAVAASAQAEAHGREPTGGVPAVAPDRVAAVAEHYAVSYDATGDRHYDVTSALIKSIRGSDVDAALHYVAVMLDGGEDLEFMCRRLMICAAEDISLADPSALNVAVNTHHAVTNIGMPEARILLAECVIYLSLAPKSGSALAAIDAALADVRAGRGGDPPAHIKDAHYAGARDLGHGVGYSYPHDDARGITEQQYLPDDLLAAEYYTPTTRGAEGRWHERLAALRAATKPRGR